MASRKHRARCESYRTAPYTPAELARQDAFLEAVGKALKDFREQAGMTQRQLAQGASLSRSVYSRMENGLRSPLLQEIERVARVLRVSAEELFTKAVKRTR